MINVFHARELTTYNNVAMMREGGEKGELFLPFFNNGKQKAKKFVGLFN